MKKNMLLMALLCYTTMSYAFTVDNITYTIFDGNKVRVTGLNSSLVDVVIPSEVTFNNQTYSVKEIGYKGLSSKPKMETLVISEGIESIRESGVNANQKLKSVSLPSSLLEIGKYAFSSCGVLTDVVFPNGSNLQTIGEYAFNNCKKLKRFEIPSSVTSIKSYAFYHCEEMESITIPENLTVIEEYSFAQCTSLETLIMHDNITHINNSAFSGCRKLFNIDNHLPESLVLIGESAFSGVPGFKHLVLSGNLVSIKSSSFSYCDNLEYVWFQEGISSIGQAAFLSCSKLKYIVLPSTLKTVEQSAFGGFSNSNHIARTFIFLADEPCQTKFHWSQDYWGNNYPDQNTWSFGKVAEGDRFYVKESAIDKYNWSVASKNIFYQIPFNADLDYSTDYREFDMDFQRAAESGNKPFVATEYGTSHVVFTSIDSNIVPAETAIVIRKQNDENTWFQIAEQQGAQLDMSNYLKGLTYSDEISPVTNDGQVNYILYNGKFCRFNKTGFLGDHKAYLQLPESSAGTNCSMIFDDNQTDGITDISEEDQNGERYYNLKGVPVEKPEKGIYITKGKKIIVK